MPKDEVVITQKNKMRTDKKIVDGCRDYRGLIAPSYIGYNEDCMKVDDNYVRTFVINGYPSAVSVGFLDKIYNSNVQSYTTQDEKGDIDVISYIEPIRNKVAKDTLTTEITKYETQLLQEYDRASNRNITYLQDKIEELYRQRRLVERNWERMFIVTNVVALYNHDKKSLNKESQKLISRLDGDTISLTPLFMRDIEGYKSCSPYAVNSITKFGRNMSTEALADLFPFYNTDINHPGGIPVGINKNLSTMIYIDFFNLSLLKNANIFISGASGSGKSYFASMLITRSILIDAVKTVIVDVEGEFTKPTLAIGGACVNISLGSEYMINPFDLAIEYELDGHGNPTGYQMIDIKSKVSDLLSMFSIMVPEYTSDSVVRADMATCLQSLYADFGFSEDPESMYDIERDFDEENEVYINRKVKKVMPRISDAREYFLRYAEKTDNLGLFNFAKALSMFSEGGIYDLFDCYTNLDLGTGDEGNSLDLTDFPCVSFNISKVEDDILRPVVMQVLMSWIWTRFVKTDLKTKKRIVCDEAWTMMSRRYQGSDYTAGSLENFSRRIRKYNGSLLSVTQNFREFANRDEGLAVLSNSAVKMFFNHEADDIAAVQGRFLLTDGEKSFILSAVRGDFLIKIGKETVVAHSKAYDFEDRLMSKNYLKR